MVDLSKSIWKDNLSFVKQEPIVDHLIHYRNMFATPEYFIRRKVDYSKMKVVDEKYRKERERLDSFNNFPIRNRSFVEKLAKAAFYYVESISPSDQVICIFCKGTVTNWNTNDNPMKRHRHRYPTCPFVISLNVGNIALSDDPSSKIDTTEGEKFKDNPIVNSSKSDQGIESSSIFYEIMTLDFNWREKTFVFDRSLISLALEGFFVVVAESGRFLCCCWCDKRTEILDDVETLDHKVFHHKICRPNQLMDPNLGGNNIEFCEVEFSVTPSEIDARLESTFVHVFLGKLLGKSKYSKETLKAVVETRLKKVGKDFDSQYEFLTSLVTYPKKKNNKKKILRTQKLKNVSLSDFQCVVCLDNPVEVVFLPCGHLKTCESCSNAMVTCPVCRVVIERRVKNIRFNY